MKFRVKSIVPRLQAAAVGGAGVIAAQVVSDKVAPELGLDDKYAALVPLVVGLFGPDLVKGRTGNLLKPAFDGMAFFATANLITGILPDDVKSQLGIAGLYETTRATYQTAIGGGYYDASPASVMQAQNSAVS